MALFPMFVNLKNQKVLVVGGGIVALRKIEKLIPFEPDLKVISLKFNHETEKIIKQYKIPYEKRPFNFNDLNGVKIVIVAVDNIDLQKKIFEFTRNKNILVNSVDSPEYCDFIFPAYVKKGDIVIGITTSGTVPGLSARIRKHIENNLPEDIEYILSQLKHIRKSLPKGKDRQRKIIELINKLFPKN